ncbi:MAG: hypothetical protein QOG55_1395 [Acidobacteriaceae bacterium]|nr:hypothetical protein [Acidobacteriaceae bacterium]
MPVAGEKCGDVAAIPGCLLGVEDSANGATVSLAAGSFVSRASE